MAVAVLWDMSMEAISPPEPITATCEAAEATLAVLWILCFKVIYVTVTIMAI